MNNIEILENKIENVKKYNTYSYSWTEQDIKAIENLIQENKELKEHLEKYYNGELFTVKQLKSIEENQKKYFIHKSKIKEKIEEMKRYRPVINKFTYSEIMDYEIKILQELLEEGE